MSEIVLTINVPDDEMPLVDAAFLTSLMTGMTKRDDSHMQWCITVNGKVFDQGSSPADPKDLYELAQRVTDETFGPGTWQDPRQRG